MFRLIDETSVDTLKLSVESREYEVPVGISVAAAVLHEAVQAELIRVRVVTALRGVEHACAATQLQNPRQQLRVDGYHQLLVDPR